MVQEKWVRKQRRISRNADRSHQQIEIMSINSQSLKQLFHKCQHREASYYDSRVRCLQYSQGIELVKINQLWIGLVGEENCWHPCNRSCPEKVRYQLAKRKQICTKRKQICKSWGTVCNWRLKGRYCDKENLCNVLWVWIWGDSPPWN